MTMLQKFLNAHKCTDNTYTHTSLVGGKWTIGVDEYKQFYKCLYSSLKKGRELYLTERHLPDKSPIFIDFDFRYNDESLLHKSPVSINIIDNIIYNFTTILKTHFQSDTDFRCLVLQRSRPYKSKNLIKDGLHICFPNVVTCYTYQFALREYYIQNYLEEDIKDIPNIPENRLVDVYDKSVVQRNNWMVYGCTKKGIAPYALIKIYNTDVKLSFMKDLHLLSLRNKTQLSTIIEDGYDDFINEYVNSLNKSVKKHKSQKKIINNKKKNSMNKTNSESSDEEIDVDVIPNNINTKTVKKLLDMLSNERCDVFNKWIKIGLILFNIEYQDKDNDYFTLWKLWSKSSPKYTAGCCRKYWTSFTYKEDGLKEGSLHYYAKKDNPCEYEKMYVSNVVMSKNPNFMDEQLKINDIIKSFEGFSISLNNLRCPFIQGNHNEPKCYIAVTERGMIMRCRDNMCFGKTHPLDSAVQLTRNQHRQLFVNINIDQSTTNITNNYDLLLPNKSEDVNYLSIDMTTKVFDDTELNTHILNSLSGTTCDIAYVFYHIYKNKYKCTKGGQWYIFKKHRWNKTSYVRNSISMGLPKYYKQMYLFATTNTQLEKFTKKIVSIINNLKTTNFINNIITEAANIFFYNDEDFFEKLDANKYLIGFDNGVYDLENHKFRDGEPLDHVSISVGYDYEVNPSHIGNVMKIISQIIPNPNIRTYMLKVMSVCLTGQIVQNVFLYNGAGSNGKSLLLNLLRLTLGPYCCKIPVSLITQKRSAADCATPQLARAQRARCIVFSEPNKNDKLNAGIIKELTGGEKLTVRGLYKEPIEFMPMFKVFILCNFLPTVNEEDYAIWRRLRNIQFTSTFVVEPDVKKNNQFPIDPTLETKIINYKSSFMNILID